MNEDRIRTAAYAALLRAFTAADAPTSYVCMEVLRRVTASPETRITRHYLGLLLDELEVGLLEDDVWEALNESALFYEERGALILSPTHEIFYEPDVGMRKSVPVAAIADLFSEAPRLEARTPLSPAELVRSVERVGRWARALLGYAADHELPGFPVFWQHERDSATPLGLDVGSMASVDTVACLLEPTRYGWPLALSAHDRANVIRAWQYALSLGIDRPDDWYDGAIFLPQFDDDFVGSFLPAKADRGSCPTTEAVANRVIGLLTIAHAIGDAEAALLSATMRAVAAAIRCLGRWQLDTGAWANHRYPNAASQLPPRDVSCQYACEALVETARSPYVTETLRAECRRQLARFSEYLLNTMQSTGGESWWLGDFAVDSVRERLRTTTLVGLVLGSVAQEVEDEQLAVTQESVVRYIASNWNPQEHAIFESTFRSPTWDGPALSPFTWDMVADGFMLCAVVDWSLRGGDLGSDLEAKVVRAVEGVVQSEYHGAWLDVPMLREGKRRAFVSNTLHNLRGVLAACAWMARAFPPGVGSARVR